MQQMKPNVVVFDSRIKFDRDGDQTGGEDAARDGPSHAIKGNKIEVVSAIGRLSLVAQSPGAF